MKRQIIHSPAAPEPIGPYSQAVAAEGQRTTYLSGQIAIGPDGSLVQEDIQQETLQVMRNIGAVLEAAGLDFDNIVKTSIFLIDMADFPQVNEVYARFFQHRPPARETVAVAGLPKGARVEISCIAVS